MVCASTSLLVNDRLAIWHGRLKTKNWILNDEYEFVRLKQQIHQSVLHYDDHQLDGRRQSHSQAQVEQNRDKVLMRSGTDYAIVTHFVTSTDSHNRADALLLVRKKQGFWARNTLRISEYQINMKWSKLKVWTVVCHLLN